MIRLWTAASIVCVFAIACIGCSRREQPLVFPDFNPYALSKIVFGAGTDHQLELNRISCKQWTVTQNGQAFLADLSEIQSFVSMISSMAILPPEKKPKPGYPEKCKGTQVRIEANGTYSFYVKKTGALYQSSYIQLDGSDRCIHVTPFINCVVNLPIQKWIKKSVFDTDADSIREIVISQHGSPVFHASFDPAGRRWTDQLCSDTDIPVDTVASLYTLLHKIKIYDAAADSSVPAHAFDSPALEIEVRDTGQCSAAFTLGSRKNSSFYFARRCAGETGALLFSALWVEKLERIISDTTGTEFHIGPAR